MEGDMTNRQRDRAQRDKAIIRLECLKLAGGDLPRAREMADFVIGLERLPGSNVADLLARADSVAR
jgi:hypothetical protein